MIKNINNSGVKDINTAYVVSIGNGLESFIYHEVEGVIKRGVNVTLFATKYKSGDVYSPKKEWNLELISPVKILISFIYYLLKSPVNTALLIVECIRYKSLIELFIAFDYSLRMKKADIHHIHCVFGDRKLFLGYYCKRLTNIPLSVTIHAHEIYANPNKPLFEKCINEADKIVTISDKNKTILIEKYGVHSRKIKTIRLSIDLENFKHHRKIKVLTVSRFEERKGFRELFDAINAISKDDVEFIVVGFGELDIRGLIKDRGIEDRVTVFDKMSGRQLRFFYNNCDIFCLPSKHTIDGGSEGIPVVLMEAMASEMLVVTTANGSISELVDNIIVKEGDYESLSIGLLKAINLIKEDAMAGVENKNKVISQYSDKNITELNDYLYQ
jgi:colanic acid/amylovoran biosynthesis glycosyltransferase